MTAAVLFLGAQRSRALLFVIYKAVCSSSFPPELSISDQTHPRRVAAPQGLVDRALIVGNGSPLYPPKYKYCSMQE